MGYWRREFLRKAESVSAGVPFILPLPRAGKLGSLLINVSATDATGLGQSGGKWRPIDFLSKIGVYLDGSIPVKVLTGYEVAALAFWDQGVMDPTRYRNYATNEQSQYLLVNFGRWMRDTDMGLDLSRYNSAELQIENNFAATDLTGVTVTVEGYFLEDTPINQFVGYLRTEEWRAWTTVSDQWVYNELPTEGLLRRVMLQAIPPFSADGVANTNMSNLMYDIEMSLDTGGKRVYVGGLDSLMRENHYYMGRPAINGGLMYMSADKGADFGLGYGLYRAGISGSKDGAVSAVVPTITADENNGTQTPQGYEADSPIEMINVGMAPYYTACLNFDDDGNPMTWLDAQARKVVKLDIHTRSGATYAGGRNAIILDRLVKG